MGSEGISINVSFIELSYGIVLGYGEQSFKDNILNYGVIVSKGLRLGISYIEFHSVITPYYCPLCQNIYLETLFIVNS